MTEAAPQRAAPPPPVAVSLPLMQALRIASEYEQAGRFDEAEELLRPMLEAAPEQPEVLHLAGLVAFRRERLAESVRLIEQAIASGANSPLPFRNICAIYERLGRYDEAIAAGRRAVELDAYDPEAFHNLSIAHCRLVQLDECLACARRALALDPALPAPHFALAEALLLRGEFEAGWEEYEWRFRIAGADRLLPQTDRPQWDGTKLQDGALLLIADQGFGDVIQFSRYIPWVQQRCPKLVLACGPEMQLLLRHSFPGLEVTGSAQASRDVVAVCPLSGLPRLHGTRLGTIPADTPYLAAEPGRVAAWQRRLDRLLPAALRRIGLVWAGRPQPQNRSADLQALAPITALDGVAVVSLQIGQAQDEVGSYYGHAPLLSLGHEIADFMDTAAIIANLDAVVAIDTAVAHLAAALGKPTWIMLPYAPDWRWLLTRQDSPWYPTARLFRQPTPRQWEPVVAGIAEDLRRSLAAPR